MADERQVRCPFRWNEKMKCLHLRGIRLKVPFPEKSMFTAPFSVCFERNWNTTVKTLESYGISMNSTLQWPEKRFQNLTKSLCIWYSQINPWWWCDWDYDVIRWTTFCGDMNYPCEVTYSQRIINMTFLHTSAHAHRRQCVTEGMLSGRN